MSEEQNNKVVALCYKNLDKFTDIYKDGSVVNPIPKDVKLTIFCEGSNEEGFITNLTSNEIGLELLIAKKWILHSELESIAGFKID
jgi:hypothetical protein